MRDVLFVIVQLCFYSTATFCCTNSSLAAAPSPSAGQDAVYSLLIDPLLETKKLLPGLGSPGDYFGQSVAVYGDTAIVGVPGDDDKGSDAGAAYVFQRDYGGLGNWGQVTKLTIIDGVANDFFGCSVAISGDTVVVGTYGDDFKGGAAGAAYVFERNLGGYDNWGMIQKIVSSDGASTDYFGDSVAISGDRIVVGSRGAGAGSGSAYVFQRDKGGNDSWGEVKKLTASDGSADDRFGTSVAISGNSVIIGAPGADMLFIANIGFAYVFQYTEIVFPPLLTGSNWLWLEKKIIQPSDGAADDQFGGSVAISDDTAVIGSQNGSAYVFQAAHGGVGNWGQVKKLIANGGTGGDSFGFSVSIDGNSVVVSAHWDSSNGNGLGSGSAYTFQRDYGSTDNWGQVDKLTAGDGAAGDRFGTSVAISGEAIVVGAMWDDDNGENSGSAYLFEDKKNMLCFPIKGSNDKVVIICL